MQKSFFCYMRYVCRPYTITSPHFSSFFTCLRLSSGQLSSHLDHSNVSFLLLYLILFLEPWLPDHNSMCTYICWRFSILTFLTELGISENRLKLSATWFECIFLTYFWFLNHLVTWVKPSKYSCGLRLISTSTVVYQTGWTDCLFPFRSQLKCYTTCQKIDLNVLLSNNRGELFLLSYCMSGFDRSDL